MKHARLIALALGLGIVVAVSLLAVRPPDVSAARPAQAPTASLVPAAAAASAAPTAFPSFDLEVDRAHAILSGLARRYRLLDGVTVSFGPTPDGAQAVAYYMRSEIVVNPAHAAPLGEILRHEIWHIIDWRDNGRIDWGEALPPANADSYLKR